MNPKKAFKLYKLEMLGAFVLYAVILVASIKLAPQVPEGAWRTLLMTSPMLGFFLALWAMARYVQRMDEYVRQQLLVSISLAAGVTAGLSFTYGFLEGIGYPRVSMFAVWGVLCTAFTVISLVRGLWCRN